MKDNKFEINGVKMTIINKTRFEMAGFKKAVKLGNIIRQLLFTGQIEFAVQMSIDSTERISVTRVSRTFERP